jgi:hypothetical protein
MSVTQLAIGELCDFCAGMHSKFLPHSAAAAAIDGRMAHVLPNLARDYVTTADCQAGTGMAAP